MTRGQQCCQFYAEVVHAFMPRVGKVCLVNTALRGFHSPYGIDKTTITPITAPYFIIPNKKL